MNMINMYLENTVEGDLNTMKISSENIGEGDLNVMKMNLENTVEGGFEYEKRVWAAPCKSEKGAGTFRGKKKFHMEGKQGEKIQSRIVD